MKKLFGGLKITYIQIVIFAVIAGAVTGLILLVPFPENTSFQNIGICFEAWIIFAMIIIMNAEKPAEAGVKTFLFFLISQPIVYLVQVPFCWLHWQIFSYYPHWFFLTLLTLPGGWVAWHIKKDNVASVFILSIVTTLLSTEGVFHLSTCIQKFPRQMISSVLCFGTVVFFVQSFIRKQRNRILVYGLTAVCTLLIWILSKV